MTVQKVRQGCHNENRCCDIAVIGSSMRNSTNRNTGMRITRMVVSLFGKFICINHISHQIIVPGFFDFHGNEVPGIGFFLCMEKYHAVNVRRIPTGTAAYTFLRQFAFHQYFQCFAHFLLTQGSGNIFLDVP